MTTPAKKTPAAKTPAAKTGKTGTGKPADFPKSTALKVRMTFVIELPDSGKWETADARALDAAPIAKALQEQGIAAEAAAEMAAKTVADAAKTGANEVRSEVRAYVLGEARKLARLTGAGATVTSVSYAN